MFGGVRMKRVFVPILLLITATSVVAQAGYDPQLLRSLDLEEREIAAIMRVQREHALAVRPLQADLNIEQAELARLLIDENPSIRRIEANLRTSAEIEVQIRLLEIQRELAIRRVIGTDRWTRLVQAARARSVEASGAFPRIQERLGAVGQALAEQQRLLQRAIEEAGDDASEELREQLLALRELYRQIQETLGQ